MSASFARTNYLLKESKKLNFLRGIRALNTTPNNEKFSESVEPDEFYNENFDIFEKLIDINTFGQHTKWRNSLVKLLDPFKDTKILDAAGGTGLTTRAIFNYAAKTTSKPNFSIWLCDKCPRMMKVCQNKLEQQPNYKEVVNFVEGDVHNLPFENDTFDLATFTFSFRTGVNVQQVFKELARVVKPGGRVGVLDFCYSKNPTTVERLYNLFLDHIYSKIAYVLWRKPELGYYIADNIRKSPSKEEVVEMLQAAGFGKITTKSNMGGVTYHYIGYK